MSQLVERLSQYWNKIQGTLFPWLEEELDPLTEKHQQLVVILELVRIEKFLPCYDGYEGRPQKTRSAIARSFVAKMVYNIDTTTFLLERLKSDKNIRRICGWESLAQIPSEATFSRAFADFAETELPQRAHKALIEKMLADEVILHNSRDSTAIEAREKPQKKADKECTKKKTPKKKGRPKKSEEQSELEPELTRERIINCYDLMDAAYDVPTIIEHSQFLGHVPLIDRNRRNKELKKTLTEESLARKTLNLIFPETLRYNARSTAERTNSRLKDEFGACKVRVRGHIKVACHLLFGVLTLAADQLIKLVT